MPTTMSFAIYVKRVIIIQIFRYAGNRRVFEGHSLRFIICIVVLVSDGIPLMITTALIFGINNQV